MKIKYLHSFHKESLLLSLSDNGSIPDTNSFCPYTHSNPNKMKKFTHGFLAFLFSCLTLVSYAQTSNSNVNLKDVTVISGTGLNLDICGTPDTITLYLNNSGTSALTNVSINAVLASGMHYITGSAYVTATISGTTVSDPLTENASDIQNPIFTLTNGLTSGATRYVRFLVEGDCNIFTAIGNPM